MKKKVFIDLCSIESPFRGFGVIATQYAMLFAEKQREGKEDFDICFLLPKHFKPTKEMDGVECYNMHSNRGFIQKVLPFLRKKVPQADVWHSTNQFCDYYPQNGSSKRIFTIHDYDFLFENSPEEKQKFLHVMQKRIDSSTAVTFISNFTQKQVMENSNLDGKITRTIYNGIEPLANSEQRKPEFVKGNRPFFFAIGEFRRKKKFDLLLDVMKAFPDKSLYICGNNNFDYGREIKDRIKLENITNVHIPGMISKEEKAWLFANCEAFLFPSIGEGFGLPAIEAMQFGKPVFTSSYQSLPEIVGNYGYLWPELETESMVDIIKKGLTDFYNDRTKSERAKSYAQTFTYKRHVDAYLNLYRELLNQQEMTL